MKLFVAITMDEQHFTWPLLRDMSIVSSSCWSNAEFHTIQRTDGATRHWTRLKPLNTRKSLNICVTLMRKQPKQHQSSTRRQFTPWTKT